MCKVTEFLYPRESGATVYSILDEERRARVFGVGGEWVRAIERKDDVCVRVSTKAGGREPKQYNKVCVPKRLAIWMEKLRS